jgi:glucan phosphoethanolaminetransferase (alkaline phosphatase superfamily)
MLDLIAVLWLAFAVIVLFATRANRWLVLATFGSIVLACYFAAGVWMNGVLSVAVDERSAQQHVHAAMMYELLTMVAMMATTVCLVLAWRRRPRRGDAGRRQSVAPSGTL